MFWSVLCHMTNGDYYCQVSYLYHQLTSLNCSTKVAAILKNARHLGISCGWEHCLVKWLMGIARANFHAPTKQPSWKMAAILKFQSGTTVFLSIDPWSLLMPITTLVSLNARFCDFSAPLWELIKGVGEIWAFLFNQDCSVGILNSVCSTVALLLCSALLKVW